MDKSKVRKADLFFSIVLMAISFWYFIGSIKLFISPFGRALEDVHAEELKTGLIEWYKSPGLLPMVLSIIMFLLAICLLNVARKDGARFDFINIEGIKALFKNQEFRVASIITGYLVGYIFILMPFCRRYLNLIPVFQGFPFLIATFIYLAVFIITFNEKTPKKMLFSLLIAGAGSLIITYGFGNLALVPLP